jgi:NADH:ubiquinone oxidoreductase subunit K
VLLDVHRADAAVGEHELHRLLAFPRDGAGQIFVFFILTVAAAEAAIGLAILVVLFRNRGTINVDDLDMLKG